MARRSKRIQPKTARSRRRAGAKNLGGAGEKDPRAPLGHLEKALGSVARFISAAGAPSAVIGGVAVIAHGVARFTADIDIAVVIEPSEASRLLRAAKAAGLVPRIADAEQFAQQNHVLLLRETETEVEVDVSFALHAFEIEAAQRPLRRKLGSVRLPITPLNALLIYKMVASRPQDVDDVTSLLARGGAFDAQEVARVLSEIDSLLDTNHAGEFRRLLDDR